MEQIKYTVLCLNQHRGACDVFPVFIANLLVRVVVVLDIHTFLFIIIIIIIIIIIFRWKFYTFLQNM